MEEKQPKNLKEAKKQVSSAQRLQELEHKVFQMEKTAAEQVELFRQMIVRLGELQQNDNNLRAALDGVNNKVDAVVSVTASGGALTALSVQEKMTEMKVEELVKKTKDLQKEGLLEEIDGTVDETTFVVVEERSVDGNLVSPRTQFVVGSLNENGRTKLVGSKRGDVVSMGEGKNNIRILETYSIVEKTETPAQ